MEFNNSIKLRRALFDLTKKQLISVYKWAVENEDKHIISRSDNIVSLSDYTGDENDNNKLFNIQN